MKNFLYSLFRHFFLIILNAAFLMYNVGFYSSVVQNDYGISTENYLWYLAGGFFIFVILNLYSEKTIQFFMLIEHEFSHLLGALLTFNSVVAMNINIKKGGYVQIEGGNSFIAILPYILPLFAFIFLLLKYIIIAPLSKFIILWIGFFEGFFLFRLLREVHPGQTDFKVIGRFYAFLLIVNVNMLSQGFLVILSISKFNKYLLIAKDAILAVQSYAHFL